MWCPPDTGIPYCQAPNQFFMHEGSAIRDGW